MLENKRTGKRVLSLNTNHKLKNFLTFILALITFLTQNLAYSQEAVNTTNSGHATHVNDSNNSYISSISHDLASITTHNFNSNFDISQAIHSVINSNLDLSSLKDSINTGVLNHLVDINLNNVSTAVMSHQFVTPAEAIAVNQLLATNHQEILLNSLGQAIGGNLNLTNLNNHNGIDLLSYSNNTLNNLLLPSNVNLIDNQSALSLAGNLVNYGDIVFTGNASIVSSTIINEGNAQINANGNLNLSANNIVNENASLISASGNLTITANNLINAGGIYSVNDLVFYDPVINNLGTVESQNGSITFNSQTNLSVYGSQTSVIEAYKSAITLNDEASSLKQGINLNGNNYLSTNLNLNTPNGYVEGIIGNVSGVVNTKASDLHLLSESNNLTLGNNCVKGDPLFVSTGNLSLTGSITASENLAIIAGDNITIPTNASVSITVQGTNNGHDLTMIAGIGSSNITTTGSTYTSLAGAQANGSGTTSAGINFGGTYAGGSIDLSTNNTLASNATVINTQAPTSSGNGGNVALIALSNSSTGGLVNLGSNYGINTSTANPTGLAGNVTIISNESGASAISIGSVTANGAGGGLINLNDVSSLSGSISYNANGGVVSSSLATSGINSGNIATGTINVSSPTGGLFVSTAGNYNFGGSYIDANTLNIASASAALGTSSNFANVNVSNLTLNLTSQSVFINDNVASITINNSSFGNGNEFVMNATNRASIIAINGNISAGPDLGTGFISITTGSGGITTNSSSYVLTASEITFNTSGGNLGSSSQSLNLDTTNLSVNTLNNSSTTGNAYINDSATPSVNLNNTSVGDSNTFNLTTAGPIVIIGTITAGNETGTGSIYLNDHSNGSITANQGGQLVAGSITLSTYGGDIGAYGTGNLNCASSTLAYSTLSNSATTGNVYIDDTNTASVNLTQGLAGINNNTTLNFAGSLQIETNVSNGTPSNGGFTNITAANNITQSANAGVTARIVELTAANGLIGSKSQSVDYNCTDFTITTSTTNTGYSYVSNLYNNCNLGFSNAGNVNLTTSGTITMVFGNNFNNLNLSTQNNGSIDVSGSQTVNGIANLTANGSGNIESVQGGGIVGYIKTPDLAGFSSTVLNPQGSALGSNKPISPILNGNYGILFANTGNLATTSGSIGSSSQFFQTELSNLTTSTPGATEVINGSNALNVGNSNSNGTYALITYGDLTGSGTITASVLGLYSINGTTGIGNSNSVIKIDAPNIGMQGFNASSSVYINDTYSDSTILQASGAGDIFKLTTAGPLTIYGGVTVNGSTSQTDITGSIIAIQTLSGYGIYSDTNINASNFIFLTASGNGYIAESVANNSIMTAPNIAVVSGGGPIGNGAAGATLLLNSGLVAASTVGLNNFVNITDTASNSAIFGAQSGSYFTFKANSDLNVNGSIATGAGSQANGGSIDLTANGKINLGNNGSISITANNGSISVQNNDASSGSINLYNGDNILTNVPVNSPGYIVFNIGSYSQTNTTNPNPNAITVESSGGASVYFGANGINATSNGNILNAKGQDIVFNTGSLSPSAINLGGNVTIIADPPILTVNSFKTDSVGTNIYVLTSSSDNLSLQNTSLNSSLNILDNNLAGLNTQNSLINQTQGINLNPKVDNKSDNSLATAQKMAVFLPIVFKQSHSMDSIAYNNVAKQNNGKNLVLENRSALILADTNLEIKLGRINPVYVKLKPGALVLLVSHDNINSVYNLHDKSANSVSVTANKNNLASSLTVILSPGKQLTLDSALTNFGFSYANPMPKIAYRNIVSSQLINQVVYQSDFSILSAINSIKPLKEVFKSDNIALKALAKDILKTMVVVMQTTSFKGNYELAAKPILSACK